MNEQPFEFIYTNLTDAQALKLNAKYIPSKKQYRIPGTLHRLRELYRLTRETHSKEFLDHIRDVGIKRKQLLEYQKSLKTRTLEDPEGKLRPYQYQDVEYLSKLHNAALFHDMRLGKSVIMSSILKRKGFKKGIIIAPVSTLFQWEDEIRNWTELKPLVYAGTKNKREKIRLVFGQTDSVLITSYGTIREDVDILIKLKFDFVACDEAHRLRNYKTGQSKACYKVGKRSEHRYALTGTPVCGSEIDLYGILAFLFPNHFTSYWQFADEYMTIVEGYFGKDIGKLRRKEELEEVINSVSIMRKKKNVLEWLPEKTFEKMKVELDSKQRKAYKSMLESFEYEDIDASTVLAQMTRLRQISTCPSVLGLDIPNAKEKVLLEWLSDHPNEPVIVFSMFSSYLKELQGQIKGSRLLIGEVTREERNKNVRDFQSGEYNVLLANIIVAKEGLTLDRGEVSIFLDKSFNPTDNEQAMERITPTTEDNIHKTLIIDIEAIGTYDDKINKILDRKLGAKEIVDEMLKLIKGG
ncbi:DEAD/DEAH box helicase [Paenibacillus phage vB_PlaP_API480]|uniref:Putative ATP-dependent helicase YwqA n=1 Tax=Paenibacillus larvae subsp. larvae TaxID=147375 RepID=A0A6C0QZB0_9BACL|nr:SNF2-related protein [Paenibacillus larvae]QBX06342.1 DEAD/DEAH box helicase [Paenibacillus phage vB_PlaP_API480]QHZ54054.1 putative ATP-dependent helicase YwqA [Paenibacillus larvae subsp. larvae]